MSLLRLRRPHRVIAALVACGYFWLSVALCFQHHHGILPEAEALLNLAGAATGAHVAIPLRTHITAHALFPAADHCLACEWQAANVSPALPAFTLALTVPSTPRVVTTLPRYLRLPVFGPASRAPPLA